MNLDSTLKSLEVKIGGAANINQLTWASHYTDIDQTTIGVTAISELDGLTNNATAVTMVAAPSAGKTRKITQITIENTDVVTQTVTVQINDNGTKQPIVVIGLAAGSTLQFAGSWSIIPTPGGVAGPTGPIGPTGIGAPVLLEGEPGEDAFFGIPGQQGNPGPQGPAGNVTIPVFFSDDEKDDSILADYVGGPSSGAVASGAFSSIKSIQQGIITLAGVLSNTATITSVSLANSRVIFLGLNSDDSGSTSRIVAGRIELTNATTVTAFGSQAIGTQIISWMVVEYNPGVIASVQRGTVVTGTPATITAVTLAKTTIDDLGNTKQNGTNNIGASYIDLTNTTTVTATAASGGASSTHGYQVVEWV